MHPFEEKDSWISVEVCPACGNIANLSLGMLSVKRYSHGDETVEVPGGGIQVLRCKNCALVFKDRLPSPQFLADIFTRQAGNVWTDGYSFRSEKIFESLIGGNTVDVLDIGTSNGGLLRELEGEGRRSALDVVAHPGLEDHLRGEFIRGLSDSEELTWSGQPYDIVTMFDVAEHLYRPDLAFANLQRLVKPKGFVVIETGNVDSVWLPRYGVRH